MSEEVLEKVVKTSGSTAEPNTCTTTIPIILGSNQNTPNTITLEIK